MHLLVDSWEKCLDVDPNSGKLHISLGTCQWSLVWSMGIVLGQSMGIVSIILLVWAEYGHSMGASVSGAYWAQHVLGTSNASHRMLAGVCRLRCWVGVLAQTGDGCCTITSIHSSLAGSSSSLPLLHTHLCIHQGT